MAALTHYGLDEAGALSSVSVSGSALSNSAIGRIIWHAGAGTPNGALYCDGSAISRTAYPELFAVIGTTYGAGNGSTTFNIPDLRGLFLRGDGGAGGNLGSEQTDAVREITGSTLVELGCDMRSILGIETDWSAEDAATSGKNAFPIRLGQRGIFNVYKAQNTNWGALVVGGNSNFANPTNSDLARYGAYIEARFANAGIPVANEIRPVNMAMRACIIYE